METLFRTYYSSISQCILRAVKPRSIIPPMKLCHSDSIIHKIFETNSSFRVK